MLEGEEGVRSFPQERVFLSNFFPLVLRVSLLIEVLITPAASQKRYLHSFMPSSCFVCLVFAVFIQLSYFVGFFAYAFSCAKTSQVVKKNQKNPASSPVQNQNKYPPLAIHILPRFATHGLVHPIPSLGHQQRIEKECWFT